MADFRKQMMACGYGGANNKKQASQLYSTIYIYDIIKYNIHTYITYLTGLFPRKKT